ncbi:FUSC family protein [Azospirillum lipoferum]|uniref:Efflux transporter permease fusaric acid resistance pump n=1 Tax=Azospirillum lipoferum (strain 4B) TaxID=862719 RepID=G7ZE55_AZOL4|nr:FUSC family protein [Azospirillum lipoferum]CBS89902.1 putative efflux transporter permease; fusaric acid resistance pump [Azospirillum lipoferum 4B]
MPKSPNSAPALSLSPAPTFNELVFSLKSFAASMLALYIAFGMGLPRPFWAMLTAYVVSSPLSGTVRSKAVYRVVGTVIGSIASIVLTVELINAPELLSLAVGLWVGGCLFVSLLDRTPRSYVFMLAGYTAGLIVFPGVANPEAIFDTGLARVEEIILGIVCATVIHSVVLPRGLGPVLLGKLDAALRDAERWTLDALDGAEIDARLRDRHKMATDLTELRVMTTHLPYDTSDLRWMTRPMRALQDRMVYLLPVLTAVQDRLIALRRADGTLPPDVAPVLTAVRDWIAAGAGADPVEADRLTGWLDRLAAEVSAGSAGDWEAATRFSFIRRLRSLVEIHRDCRALRAHIASGDHALPDHLDPLARKRSRGVFHLDHGMALWSAAAALLGITVICAFWILTGWSSGSMAAMMVAVFTCFFASFDDPVPGIRLFLVYTLASMPLSAFYLLVVLPSFDSFPILALCLAPTLVTLGVFVARPATMGKAMALIFGVGGSLSLLDTGTGDFASFLNSSAGQIVGIVTAMLVTRLCRSVGAAWSARRLLHVGWREIADLAGRRTVPAADGFESRMLDRVGLLSARLAQAGGSVDVDAIDAVRDLRVGLNVVELQRVRPVLGAEAGPVLDRLLRGVAAHFRALSAKRPDPAPAELLGSMDALLSAVTTAPRCPDRDRAVVALASLRRSLFPDAAIGDPQPTDEMQFSERARA